MDSSAILRARKNVWIHALFPVIAIIVNTVIMVSAVMKDVQNVACKIIALGMAIAYNAQVDFMVHNVNKHVPRSV
jgi:hypothetical protein